MLLQIAVGDLTVVSDGIDAQSADQAGEEGVLGEPPCVLLIQSPSPSPTTYPDLWR